MTVQQGYMVFGHKFTEIRHEFVIGTTRLVVKTTDRIVGKPRISRITRILRHALSIYVSFMEIYVLTLQMEIYVRYNRFISGRLVRCFAYARKVFWAYAKR